MARYRIVLSLEVEDHNDTTAYQTAIKLEALLKQPIVKMAIESEGIRLSGGDGRLVVHQPQRSYP